MSSDPGARPAEYASEDPSHTSRYVWDAVLERVQRSGQGGPWLEVGCGNGAFSSRLSGLGHETYACDISTSGARIAAERGLAGVRVASAYDDFTRLFPGVSSFQGVIALEVIEHLYDPRRFVARAVEALRPGGVLILSTPYHGYLKNLALAASGRLDRHFTALWDGGHIKFWSRRTLEQLLREAGFVPTHFSGVGRLPWLWKSMVVEARRRP